MKIKLNENELQGIISEAVKKVLIERREDMYDSGVLDYNGTGSKESSERVDKIQFYRDNYGDSFTHVPGNNKRNASTLKLAHKKFGGLNSANGGWDGKLVKEIWDFIFKIQKYKNPMLDSLADHLHAALSAWDEEVSNYKNEKMNSPKKGK